MGGEGMANRGRRKAREEVSAGGVVLRYLQGEPHVLLIRDPYRNWGLPKGHVEGEEEPPQAALREVREETGLRDLDLGPTLGTIDWHFRLKGQLIHKYCHFFLMVSRSGETVPERAEGITECRWLPVERAIRDVTYDNAREMIRVAARLLQEESSEIPGWPP